MAFRYGYFDSEIIGVDDEGMPIFDRAETSDLFALLLANLVSDGVLAHPSNCFRVRAAGSGLNLELDPGFGMIKGHFCYNSETAQLTIETVPQQYSRIDRVVMRCNYLKRMVEIIIKTGMEAANPVPPELIRPAAGDYFELCLANIRLTAGQKVITQSNITDTRPNSAVCGYITQMINHLDTAILFEQLDTFYEEFVQKTNASYEHYAAELSDYLSELKVKGDSNLLTITQQLILFKNTKEAEFLEWFEHVKGMLGIDPAGNLQIQVDTLRAQLQDLQIMLNAGMVMAKLKTDQGDYITDSAGKPLLISRPICCCNK